MEWNVCSRAWGTECTHNPRCLLWRDQLSCRPPRADVAAGFRTCYHELFKEWDAERSQTHVGGLYRLPETPGNFGSLSLHLPRVYEPTHSIALVRGGSRGV